jgi:pantoate--beta-alanine ligase
VLTVVARLFNLVQPDVACFGQKDIQQVTLIRRMIAQLGFPLTLRVVPTLRDADGLAMSSRNTYLAPDDRARALALSRALRGADAAWAGGERRAARLAAVMESALSAEGLAADYVAIVEPDTLKEVADAPAGTIIALAVRVGSTRLIDNIILGMERA